MANKTNKHFTKMVSTNLTKQQDEELEEFVKIAGITKANFIRMAIAHVLDLERYDSKSS
jgi:predicted DNA-binding protein